MYEQQQWNAPPSGYGGGNLGGEFDSSQHDSVSEYEVMPAGWYPMAVVESEVTATKAGTGTYAKLTIDIIDGQFKGQKVFKNVNLQNPNPKAVKIGQKEMATLCRAAGVLKLNDTSQLHGKAFVGKLKIKPANGDYDARNELTNCLSYQEYQAKQAAKAGQNGNSTAPPPTAPPAQQAPSPPPQQRVAPPTTAQPPQPSPPAPANNAAPPQQSQQSTPTPPWATPPQ